MYLAVEHFAGIQDQVGVPGFFDGLHQLQFHRVGVFVEQGFLFVADAMFARQFAAKRVNVAEDFLMNSG